MSQNKALANSANMDQICANKQVLLWFNDDLRLDDHRGLKLAQQAQTLDCIFCVNPQWFASHRYQQPAMASLRWQFLQQSLLAVNQQLQALGQQLNIVYQSPEQAIVDHCQRFDIDILLTSKQFAVDERLLIEKIKKRLPKLTVIEPDNYTLFDQQHLPVELSSLQKGYSPFKRQALKVMNAVQAPITAPRHLPARLAQLRPVLQLPHWLPDPDRVQQVFVGGELAAKDHVQQYFQSQAPSTYKQTRNALSGFSNSSKLSCWLNTGALSPRRVYHLLLNYEQQFGSNESTQWLLLELLWREYFQWLALSMGAQLFSFKGLAKNAPLTGFYAERFKKWCHGNTPYPIVNACMRELFATGYLSNRGRQIVASCFVHELRLDWRYGAAWFEQQLLDYDAAANWGNWQYIAGVGVDPRGGRHFNLAKQQQQFDPEEKYIKQWAAESNSDLALDSVDAADWPIL